MNRPSLAFALAVALGCGGAPLLTPVPPVTSAIPGPSALPSAPSVTEEAAPRAPGYSGHGVETIAPEVLAKYRPMPLSPEVSRRIESLMDVRAPGIGALSPDGKIALLLVDHHRHRADLEGRRAEALPAADHRRGRQHHARGHHARRAHTSSSSAIARARRTRASTLQPAAGGPLEVIQHVHGVQTHFEAVSSDGRFVYFTSNDTQARRVRRVPLGHRRRRRARSSSTGPRRRPDEGLWHVSDLKDDGRLLLRKETGSVTAEYFEWDPARHGAHAALRPGREGGVRRALRRARGRARRPDEQARRVPAPLRLEGREAHAPRRRHQVRRRRLHDRSPAHAHPLHGQRRRLHAARTRSTRRRCRPVALPAFPDADHVYVGDDDARRALHDDRRRRRAPPAARAASSTGPRASSSRGTPRARPRSTRRRSRAPSSRRTPRATARRSRCSCGGRTRRGARRLRARSS